MNQQTTAVEIGEITIPILKGGFFDRYRLNPDLDVIQEEFDIENMSFFEGVPSGLKARIKTKLLCPLLGLPVHDPDNFNHWSRFVAIP